MPVTDPAINVSYTSLSLKFFQTVKVSALHTSAFRLFLGSTEIASPFGAIDTFNDYNSISRTITLYFAQTLLPNTQYTLLVSGLTDSASRSIPDVNYLFVTLGSAVPGLPATPELISVIDHSIIPEPFVPSASITAPDPQFYLVSTYPEFDITFIDDNIFNNGRVVIKFSTTPDDQYLTTQYFRVQRKLITRAVSRWEAINVTIARDGINPSSVNINFPLSNEATPVYFSNNYKYRIKVSRDIAHGSSSLDEDQYLIFLVGVSPIYIDPEDLKPYFLDASLTEIAEIVYNYSQEAVEITGSTAVSPPILEFVQASTLCALSRIYDIAAGGDETSIALADLQVTTRSSIKDQVTRATATTWCELAGVIRDELYRHSKSSGIRGVVRGDSVVDPTPKRFVQHQEWRGWTPGEPMTRGNKFGG